MCFGFKNNIDKCARVCDMPENRNDYEGGVCQRARGDLHSFGTVRPILGPAN